MLEKKTSVDSIEISSNGCVHVREKISVFEDGEEISSSYSRHTILPGDDFSKEDVSVQDVCDLVQTKEVVLAYKKALES